MDKKSLQLINSAVDLLLSMIGFYLLSTPFVKLEFGSAQRKITAFDFLGDVFRENHQYFLETDFELGEPWIIGTFIASLAFLVASLISLILSALVYTNKIHFNTKLAHNANAKNVKTTAILNIVISMIVGAAVMILDLCTLQLTGYDSNPLARLGGGAIASGIIFMLTAISSSIFTYFIGFFESVPKRKSSHNVQHENNNWISDLKNIKELYDVGVLSEEEYKEEKDKIMSIHKQIYSCEEETKEEQQIAPISKRKLTGKYVSGNVTIIIENESFFTIKSKGLMISQGRVKEENDTVVFSTKDNKKMTFNRQGDDLVSLKGVVYVKK